MDKIFKPCHVLHGESHARAYWQCGPACVQADCPQEYWALLPQAIARAFCGNLVEKHMTQSNYFEPSMHWPKPILPNPELNITLTRLQYLGNTKSRREMNVFAAANPARLPLSMGLVQHGVPFTRMGVEQRTGLLDALVLILKRFLMPASEVDVPQDNYFRATLVSLAAKEKYWPSTMSAINKNVLVTRHGSKLLCPLAMSSHESMVTAMFLQSACGDCCLTACSVLPPPPKSQCFTVLPSVVLQGTWFLSPIGNALQLTTLNFGGRRCAFDKIIL